VSLPWRTLGRRP